MRNLHLPLTVAFLSSCASPYVQPPPEGNAVVRIANAGSVELRSVELFLEGKTCTDRLYVPDSAARAAINAGGPLVVRADREIALTLEATRSVSLSGGVITRSVCHAAASFTPRANTKYRMSVEATGDYCAVKVYIEQAPDGSKIETLDPTYRARQRRATTLGGPACSDA